MSQQPESDLDLFARVKDSQIVEFPVFRLHIKNRAHPLSWYTSVYETAKPELPPFHYHHRTVRMEPNGRVVADYHAVAYTLAELLAQLRPFAPETENQPPVPSIEDLDPALVERIYGLASDYLTDKLNSFAATRGYGTPTTNALTSVLSYLTSNVPKFKAEAERVQSLRDAAWVNMMAFFDQVSSGAIPVPTSIDTIDALIPAMNWPDQDPV